MLSERIISGHLFITIARHGKRALLTVTDMRTGIDYERVTHSLSAARRMVSDLCAVSA